MIEFILTVLGGMVFGAFIAEIVTLPIRRKFEARYGLKDHRPGNGSQW